jgi:hypothetical protein
MKLLSAVFREEISDYTYPFSRRVFLRILAILAASGVAIWLLALAFDTSLYLEPILSARTHQLARPAPLVRQQSASQSIANPYYKYIASTLASKRLRKSFFYSTIMFAVGMSPSGKAAGSGPAIRGFESLHPSQIATFAPRERRLTGGTQCRPLVFQGGK